MAPVSTAAQALTYTLSPDPLDAPSPLTFRPVTEADIDAINSIVNNAQSLTCDYTIGGILMWASYFNYSFCIYRRTLFIMGVEENRPELTAFSCPVGQLPLPEAIALLKTYCRQHGLPLRFSAIPADKLACFATLNPECLTEELTDWADYVYEAESFATLAGKKMAKKRNHFNHFAAEYPLHTVEELTPANAAEALEALEQWNADHTDDEEATVSSRAEELAQVRRVLLNLDAYPFEGIVLRSCPGGSIIAFTAAEIIGSMAFVHIEKMNHRVNGAGETVAHLFMDRLMARHPELRYVNREEDCGDPGLRRAKESWHPAMLLKKYNVTL